MIRRTAPGWDAHRVRQALAKKTTSKLVDHLLRTPTERAVEAANDPGAADVSFMGMDAIAEAVAEMREPALALVIDYTSQTRDANHDDDPGLRQLMLTSLMVANSHSLMNDAPIRFVTSARAGQVRHPVIWLVDRPDDLPVWLTRGDGIRQIPVGAPDVDTRGRIAQLLIAGQVPPDQVGAVSKRFADATEGFSTRGMFEAVQLARGTNTVADDIEGAVRTYREGLTENPWRSPRLRELLRTGEAFLARRVKGQDEAIGRVLDVLKRSSLGLTGAHSIKQSTAPRGILYFAGPTGVGKTEMAKAIAELVFADDRALLRFDMSEFRDEHAKHRLVGAPPGYVGYGSGGELTSAVLRRPHSIVLFDEMDKAGAEVFDLFLQILSDGRLTDGAGTTVSFSQTLIIFTSNKGADTDGITSLDVENPEQAAHYESLFLTAIKDDFEHKLQRPELYGRFGDNFVVFRPIQGRFARDMANQFIDTVLGNVKRRVGNTVAITDQARADLIDQVTSKTWLKTGGRGITKAIETRLANPLGRLLFNLGPNQPVTITGISDGEPADLVIETP
jgi:ATP-dependent Clp protease ATP-binding subunit ClpA